MLLDTQPSQRKSSISEVDPSATDSENNTESSQKMALDTDAVIGLEAAIKGNDLPTSLGGLFFGHEFQDESATDYREQDLEFCKWARGELKAKKHVYYDCWW